MGRKGSEGGTVDQNYLKFYIGKRLLHRAFRNNGASNLFGSVLDIGAGTVPYEKDLAGCRLITLERAIRFQPAVVGSATLLPFASKTFDGVICTEVLEHLSEPEACLEEAHRVLRPGGRMYVTTPMTWYLHYEPDDYFRFTPYGLRYLLEKHDFAILRLERIGGLAAVLGMVASEKFYRLLYRLFFFVPKMYRPKCIAPFILPLSWVLYYLTCVIDSFRKRWVYSVCILAEKKD